MGNRITISVPDTIVTQRKLKKCFLKANSELVAEEIEKQQKQRFRRSWNDGEVLVGPVDSLDMERVQRYALQMLPEELWMRIFSDLENFSDTLSCYHTCTYFHDFLEDRVSKVLFWEVFPLVLRQMDVADILKCRLVNKRWNEEVDKLMAEPHASCQFINKGESQELKNYVVHSKNVFRKLKPYVFVFPYSIVSRWKGHKVQNGNLWLMRHHPRNPFVHKQVCLVEWLRTTSLSNWIAELSLAFGYHVEQLHLIYLPNTSSPYTVYQDLIQVLRDFKNLKILQVDLPEIEWEEEAAMWSYWSTLKATPLPEKGADFVECKLVGNTMGAQVTQMWVLTRYCHILKYIQCSVWLTEHSDQPWPNLRWLHILEEAHATQIFPFLRDTDAPNLNTLALKVKITGKNILQLVRISKRFTSLSHLVLTVVSCGDVFKRKMLHYPSIPHFPSWLSRLEIIGDCVKFRDFDFLLFFPFIRELYLENVYCTQTKVKRDAVIDLAECLAQVKTQGWAIMYRSTIWDILPFLRLLKVIRDGGAVSKRFDRSDMEGM